MDEKVAGSYPPPLPLPRGPLSAALLEHLRSPVRELPHFPSMSDDPLWGDDTQLALYCCYELHYRSFAGVAEGWEWEPSLLALRRSLEEAFEHRLREEVGGVTEPDDVATALRAMIDEADGPSLSCFMRDQGTIDHLREFAVHRSAYQLKEADPHTWAIPRLTGSPKVALVEIQYDEYGSGSEAAMHSTLFANTMSALGLDAAYGAYLDLLPGLTLATTNLISLFGLHRRWRGALVGHLAIFEATSVGPMGRYSEAVARHGLGREAARFYDAHVEVDPHHEVVALGPLAAGLAATEPHLGADIIFGARSVMVLEERFAGHLLDSWREDRTSLLHPLPQPALPSAPLASTSPASTSPPSMAMQPMPPVSQAAR